MNQNITIVGAGMAGLLAACHFKSAHVIDRMEGPTENHQALLRFRSTAVSELTGIPFTKVTVQKAVYSDDRVMSYASIRDQNLYAKKVSGGVTARSIANLDSCERYVAPDDFYHQLVSKCEDRIDWATDLGPVYTPGHPIISTAPMAVNLKAGGIDFKGTPFTFDKSSISVNRYYLTAPSNVYQTVYFPDPDMNVYRASISGDVLIIESLIDDQDPGLSKFDLDIVLYAFGLDTFDIDIAGGTEHLQNFGKMVDMPKEERQALMFELTHTRNIFSLGRFATWRNVLLDDVVSDIAAIERLINAGDYSRRLLTVR